MNHRYGTMGTTEEARLLQLGQCPICNSRTFIGGPRGGLAINVGCAECFSWWNLSVIDGVVLLHHPCPAPPSGTRRTEPGPLLEVTKLGEPPHAPHPECPWCGGAGKAPEETFTMTIRDEPRVVDCLCRFMHLRFD